MITNANMGYLVSWKNDNVIIKCLESNKQQQGRRKSGASGAIAPQILGILHYQALYGSIFGWF